MKSSVSTTSINDASAYSDDMARYFARHEQIVQLVVPIVLRCLVDGNKITIGDSAYMVKDLQSKPGHKWLKDLSEMRIHNLISLAAAMGAFAGHGIEVRRGVGWAYSNLTLQEAREAERENRTGARSLALARARRQTEQQRAQQVLETEEELNHFEVELDRLYERAGLQRRQ